ncbi:putative ribonuclease H-like domain-containing protein [Tanacetum coccineum]|uniref:Ribonuclease H-like domain-containing protein n=1 Tax=Tanacetum coccineum TaxID=301880 RepID=A0ABQ5J1L3_9ASTR
MYEAKPIPPTSSVTALRIPMIKKGEYDLWSMKMRYSQNIAFLSTEVKGSTLKQSTADLANIPKGYTQATSSKMALTEVEQDDGHGVLMSQNMVPLDKKDLVLITKGGLFIHHHTTRERFEKKLQTKMTMTEPVPSKSTANVVYQGTARPKVPHAVPSQSTDRPYYPRMDNTRPRTSSFSPSSRSSTTRTPHRPQRPKKIVKSIWVKKGSTVGSQAVLPQTVKESAMIKSNQTWRPKGAYLDSVNRDNGSYTLKQFEYVTHRVERWEYDRRQGQAVLILKSSRWVRCFEKTLKEEESRKGTIKKTSCITLRKSAISMGMSTSSRTITIGKGDLVRGLPSKTFKLEHSCLACRKGKQHRASCKKIEERTVREPLELLHIDLFGPVLVESDETYEMLMIDLGLENKLRHKVKEDHQAVSACYVLNRVLVTKPQMKTPYEILMGRSPNISFMRPFGCPLTILNTLDHLGKFDGKSEEGYLLGYSTNTRVFRVYNRVTRKVSRPVFHVNFLEIEENQKEKEKNYADSRGQETACNDVEDLDDQQFIVHGPSINAVQNKHSEEHTADKEVPLFSDEQALHDELVSLMHQESLAKSHNDAQRNAFEEEKRRIALEKGKDSVNSTFTLRTANTPSQSTGNTPTDSDDDVPKDGVFSTNSFDDENTVSGFKQEESFKTDIPQQVDLEPIMPASTPLEAHKSLGKREEGEDVDFTPKVLLIYKLSKDLRKCSKNGSKLLCSERGCKITDLIYGFNVMNTESPNRHESNHLHSEESCFFHSKDQAYSDSTNTSFRDCYEQRLINVVKVAGKDDFLISEATIRADLLIDDEKSLISFPRASYLGHAQRYGLRRPKSTSWEQFGTNIASALVGLATNQKFNFSLMILNGMLGHISNGTPFLMYPRFVQLFLNKQLEGVDRPQDFIPSVSLPSKVFTFMRKHSTKFSCRITPLTPSMLEVVTALAAEEEHSTSPHSRAASSARDAQGSPTQSAAHSQRTASVQGTASFHSTAVPHDSDAVQGTDTLQGTATSQGTAEIQRTADFQGTAEPHDAASIPKSPNDYTPTDASQTSGGDEGLLDIYALNREVRRLKKQTLSQAKQILKLKAKLKKLSKFVQPVVKHHAFWVENQNLKKQKRRRKKHKKKVSSVKLGRNKDEGTLSEEHYVQEEDTAHPFFDDIVDKDAAVNPDLERKSDETEEVNIEEKEASNVKSGETEELDLETTQSTARQGTITPRTLNFEDEAGPSSPLRPIQIMESEEHLKAAEVEDYPKDKGKGILVEEPKKKKMTLQQISKAPLSKQQMIRGAKKKIQENGMQKKKERRLEELKNTKPKTTLRKPTTLAQ